ncbi:DNA translocase FtsK [Veronia pacifica]|uniref:DNA translocase FtsK n=1 Tax=Veronia pacifica TaxID=1080227 RepID=A0A1C3EM21_9GAMM|nr:DNA translocase FtsK 4TM domain-containing protein [Veronia pacifica]ODA34274.1 cell division protein FtsK [Veronia pacifica]
MEFSLQQEQKAQDKKLSRLNGAQRLKESTLILALLAAVFIAVALMTYDPADPSWSQTAQDSPIGNAAGSLGAFVADTLFFALGKLAYLLPAVLLLAGWVFLRRRTESEPLQYTILASRILGMITLFLSSCGLADLNFDDFWYYSSGGVVGDVLNSVLIPLLNVLGTTLSLLFFWAAGFTLFTGISWLTIVDKLGEVTLNGVTWAINRIRNDKPQTFSSNTKSIGESETPDFSVPANHGSRQLTDISRLNKAQRAVPDTFEKPESKPKIVFAGEDRPEGPEQAVEQSEMNEPEIGDLSLVEPASQQEMIESPVLLPTDQESSSTSEVHHAEEFTADKTDIALDEEETHDASSAQHTTEDTVADIEFENTDGLSELERLEQASNGADDEQALSDDEAFLETVREAQKNAAGATHPFLMKHEPDMPKPAEPLPTLDLLDPPRKTATQASREELEQTARLVEARLEDYKIQARVVGVYPGPVITRFELELAPGVKVSRIAGLAKDLARSLSTSAVRVVEVIPGKPYIGLELPNSSRETVFMSEVVGSERFSSSKSPLSVVLGKDIAGEAIVTDLSKAPHLLVAGTTGSGKSVGVNVMIVSMLYKASPEDVRFIMIDPKMLELSVYEGIPHLLTEVVTDMKDAGNALRWCVAEMERRYKLMSALGVRNIKGFNDKVKEANDADHPIPDPLWKPGDSMDENAPELEKLPYIVVIVDEFADLMMVVGKKVEELIARLAQKARAAGIHLVLATQRPSVDVITGLIKANIPTRMAFTVSTKTDSRTILDQGGAESLLGMGDMLFMPNGSNHPARVHGAFVNDDEVHRVVSNWKARGKPQYISEITSGDQGSDALLPGEAPTAGDGEELDQLFDQVVEFVTESRRGSVSGVQRRFKIGYNRAARIVDQLEAQGIVSPPGHNGNREVLAPPPPPRD